MCEENVMKLVEVIASVTVLESIAESMEISGIEDDRMIKAIELVRSIREDLEGPAGEAMKAIIDQCNITS